MPNLTNADITARVKQFDSLIKDFNDSKLTKQANDVIVKRNEFIRDNPLHIPHEKTKEKLKELITRDERMIRLKNAVIELSSYDDPVLIIGESGTGKEIIARALHGNRQGNFIAINCAGLPEYLVESELFGHKRGSFTGADYEKDGLFRAADGGSIMLDEIGELSIAMQAKLLRVIQEREYRKVGDVLTFKTTARIIAATHHDLFKLYGEGKFRLDLLGRLKVFTLITIPLRNRLEDLEDIVHSLDPSGKCYEAVFKSLEDKSFPFNVRDVQSMVRQWQVFGKLL